MIELHELRENNRRRLRTIAESACRGPATMTIDRALRWNCWVRQLHQAWPRTFLLFVVSWNVVVGHTALANPAAGSLLSGRPPARQVHDAKPGHQWLPMVAATLKLDCCSSTLSHAVGCSYRCSVACAYWLRYADNIHWNSSSEIWWKCLLRFYCCASDLVNISTSHQVRFRSQLRSFLWSFGLPKYSTV